MRLVHPFLDKPANMVLVEGVRGGRPQLTVMEPLIIYTDKGVYSQEVIDLYESDQKKVFINTFVDSVVEDEDATDMISNYLDNYLLTKKDYEDSSVSPRDCRIRTAFSYRFGVVARRKNAFSALQLNPDGSDPYFYVQEELSYTVKFLAEKGNNLNSTKTGS